MLETRRLIRNVYLKMFPGEATSFLADMVDLDLEKWL